MGFSHRFVVGFAWRLAALVGAAALLAAALTTPDLAAARIVAALLLAGSVWQLWHHIGRTNREIARFVEALRFGDFSQGFRATLDARFDELGHALENAMLQLRAERAVANEEVRIAVALADEAPSALLLIDDDNRVTLANKAARKLFARLGGTRVEDFADYGRELEMLLREGLPGTRQVLRLRAEGAVQRAIVARAELTRVGRPLAIVSIQPIQNELSTVELAAQADLVRVLTHEIMNSMTPVVSLADSAARLMAEIDGVRDPLFDDARAAVATLARRAAGIMHFVEAYRSFSRPPVLQRRRFPAAPWVDELRRLFAASDQGAGVSLSVEVAPDDVVIDADPDLLAQVVINLLKNAAEAAAAHGPAPQVTLAIGLSPGARVRLSVADNGPGIAPELAEEIFLPFFTTKSSGTGVGLSFARRIMIAHGGTIALAEPAAGGACFEITL